MSMTDATRRELYKLREVMHFLLHCDLVHNIRQEREGQPASMHLVCSFCRKPLGTNEDFTTHGNSIGPKFAAKLTVHHVDGNHDNNAPGNKALCHRSCHKAHHRREANAQRELQKLIEQGERR